MKVRFYGRLAEAIAPEIELEPGANCSIAQLREMLAASYPDAAMILGSKRSRACVGNSLADEDHLVRHGDQIEFLPPVSGG